MSTPVTFVGNQYNVPAYADTGYAQGTGNLSSYLIALATGCLTLSGGAVTLTADANFGTSFGLLAKYFTSVTANAATTGVFRLANTELVSWRDSTNSVNLTIGVNASNQFAFSGGDILMAANQGVVCTTPDGTRTYRILVDNDGNLSTVELT